MNEKCEFLLAKLRMGFFFFVVVSGRRLLFLFPTHSRAFLGLLLTNLSLSLAVSEEEKLISCACCCWSIQVSQNIRWCLCNSFDMILIISVSLSFSRAPLDEWWWHWAACWLNGISGVSRPPAYMPIISDYDESRNNQSSRDIYSTRIHLNTWKLPLILLRCFLFLRSFNFLREISSRKIIFLRICEIGNNINLIK